MANGRMRVLGLFRSDLINEKSRVLALAYKSVRTIAIQLTDLPRGRMWMKTVGSLRWTVNAAILVNGKVAALGEQVGIFVELENNKPIPMPARVKQQYQEFRL
jgi:acyl-CoA thioesterase FadM